VKTFGPKESPLQHWITPFVDALGGAIERRLPTIVNVLPADGGFYAASAGLRSSVGQAAGARAAVVASVEAGVVGNPSRDGRALAAWTAAGRAGWLAMRGEGLVPLNGATGDLTIAELRVGEERGVFLGGHAAGQIGDVPTLGRLLLGGWDAPWVPWLSGPQGWTVGGGAGIPWTRSVVTVADADYDAHSGTLLGVRGMVGYHHPCGCLAVTAWGGHRAGRAGVDSWVAVALSP
jgi:hypothetical protein